MPADDFIPLAEFRELYPNLAKKELVVLCDRHGESMWRRDADGWHRVRDDS